MEGKRLPNAAQHGHVRGERSRGRPRKRRMDNVREDLEERGIQLSAAVLGQNGSGQNGTDKMVWTKWYTDKMVLDKMAWTKWYGQNGIRIKWYWTKWHGQNGTDQILRIKSSINPALIYNMIFSSIPLPCL